MKTAKFAPVTAALLASKGEKRPGNDGNAQAKAAPQTVDLLARKGEARPWEDRSSHAEAAPEPVDFMSRSSGRAAEGLATNNSGAPPFTIDASAGTTPKLTLPLCQSDCDGLGLFAAKRDGADAKPHFANGGTQKESAQASSKRRWLKAVLSGFHALGQGPRL